MAHLAYFRQEFVLRRKWLDELTFAEVLGLCQSLPGPSSSQTGFVIGLLEGGLLGGFAAWVAFTLPSAALMFALAEGHTLFRGPIGTGILHGLQLAAVAVVAQAVVSMLETLAPDLIRRLIALLSVVVIIYFDNAISELAAIALGALLGLAFCRKPPHQLPAPDIPLPRYTTPVALTLFFLLLIAPPIILVSHPSPSLAIFQAFYRTGALVFGGGHVVLPLLQAATVTPGWIDNATFLAGYGGVQALPGPVFTFSAYLGTLLKPGPQGLTGATLALFAIFIPGLLLSLAALPFWERLRVNTHAQAILAGVNGSVVGVLGAALYRPLWTSAVSSPLDIAIVLAAAFALIIAKLRPSITVLLTATITGLLAHFHFL
jgi:chromate transporter